MSHVRRVLITLAAVLLVTGGLVTAYLATTKSAKEALRFSIVDAAGPRELIPGLSGLCSVESIAVENTGAVPVHLISMWVTESATPGVAGVNVTLAPTSPSDTRSAGATVSEVIVVPAKTTIYATSAVPLTAGTREYLRMNVLSQPRTQYLMGRALEWLHARSPHSLQPHIPSLSASIDSAEIK